LVRWIRSDEIMADNSTSGTPLIVLFNQYLEKKVTEKEK